MVVGDTIIVEGDVIDDSGSVILAKGQPVTVRELVYRTGYWSKLCPGLYIADKLLYIKINECRGDWVPNTFIV